MLNVTIVGILGIVAAVNENVSSDYLNKQTFVAQILVLFEQLNF